MRNIEQKEPKTLKNVKVRKRPNTFLTLVTITVISRRSCNISRESFKLLNTLIKIPKIGPKILHNAPSLRISTIKFS